MMQTTLPPVSIERDTS